MAYHKREIITMDDFMEFISGTLEELPADTVIDVPSVRKRFIEKYEPSYYGVKDTTEEEIYQALIRLIPRHLIPERISHFKVVLKEVIEDEHVE